MNKLAIMFLGGIFSLVGANSFAQTIQSKVQSCEGGKQYFKFVDYKSEQTVFVVLKAGNITPSYGQTLEINRGPSVIYNNKFKAHTGNYLSGNVTTRKQNSIICSMVFSCDCEGTSCMQSVTTQEEDCSVSGYGSESSPYVFYLGCVGKN